MKHLNNYLLALSVSILFVACQSDIHEVDTVDEVASEQQLETRNSYSPHVFKDLLANRFRSPSQLYGGCRSSIQSFTIPSITQSLGSTFSNSDLSSAVSQVITQASVVCNSRNLMITGSNFSITEDFEAGTFTISGTVYVCCDWYKTFTPRNPDERKVLPGYTP
jgi:hypothetical protein